MDHYLQLREEDIAACMKDQGFPYVMEPIAQAPGRLADNSLDPAAREWPAHYGFGVSTQHFDQDLLTNGALGIDEPEPSESPNEAILAEMDGSLRGAYFDALRGDDGCLAKAGQTERAFESEFGAELYDLYERVEADQRVVEMRTGTIECVFDQGLDYLSVDVAVADLNRSVSEIEQTYGLDQHVGPEPFAAPAQESILQLQAAEIRLATAVFDCGGNRHRPEYWEIYSEYERIFLDENAGRVSEFVIANE